MRLWGSKGEATFEGEPMDGTRMATRVSFRRSSPVLGVLFKETPFHATIMTRIHTLYNYIIILLLFYNDVLIQLNTR